MDVETLRHLVQGAGFIFHGSVQADWKGEAPSVPTKAEEIVTIRIERVLRSTPVLRGLVGHDALVITRHAEALRQSHGPILFTECISLGKQLLLREIDHVGASDETSRQVAEAIREADERPLRERVAAADLIVTGEVAESEMTGSARSPESEHDPMWWIARVTVKSVVKGRKPSGKLEVLFASSADIAWFKSPKLYPGTSGILLLQHVKADDVPKEVSRTAYQATDPLDLIPVERLAEVERALGEDRGER